MNDEILQWKHYLGYDIAFLPDECADCPRNDDNLGTILCGLRRYRFGDIIPRTSEEYFDMRDEMMQTNGIYRDIEAYIHSNIHLTTGTFNGKLPQGHYEFDTCHAGYIYASRERILEWFGAKRITKHIIKKVEETFERELQTLTAYLNGECLRIEISKDGKGVDFLSGFYDYDEALDEAKRIINNLCELQSKKGK